MATFRSNSCLLLLLHLLLLSMEVEVFAEMTTHLHFYLHKSSNRPGATAFTVARGPSDQSPIFNFGDILVMDDPMTEEPNLTSSANLWGRCQGLQVFDSASAQGVDTTLFIASILFQEGEFNGSKLAVVEDEAILTPLRELAVVGGSGRFRLARGYAVLKTYWVNVTTGAATLEWDIYAMRN